MVSSVAKQKGSPRRLTDRERPNSRPHARTDQRRRWLRGEENNEHLAK